MTSDSIVFSDEEAVFAVSGAKSKYLSFNRVVSHFSASAPDFGLLPPVVRYVSPWHCDPDAQCTMAIAIVEQPPRRQKIQYTCNSCIESFQEESDFDYDEDDDDALKELLYKGSVEIPIPWSYWIFHFFPDHNNQPVFNGNVSLFFSDSQSFDFTNKLYSPYLSNVAPNNYPENINNTIVNAHHICIGNDFYRTKFNNFSFAEYLKQPLGLNSISLDQLFKDYVGYYWNSLFNDDYMNDSYEFLKHLGFSDCCLHECYTYLNEFSIDNIIEKLSTYKSSLTLGHIINYYESSVSAISLKDIYSHVNRYLNY